MNKRQPKLRTDYSAEKELYKVRGVFLKNKVAHPWPTKVFLQSVTAPAIVHNTYHCHIQQPVPKPAHLPVSHPF